MNTEDSTRDSVKTGMVATILTAIILGLALTFQCKSLTPYFTVALPIALTAGGLAYCLAEIFQNKKHDTHKNEGK